MGVRNGGMHAASLVWACVMAMEDGRTVQVTHVDGGECTWGAKLECSLSKSMWRANLLLYIFVGIYFSAYTFFLRRGWRQLKKVPYQRYRMANLVLRFQVSVCLTCLHAEAVSSVTSLVAQTSAAKSRKHGPPSAEQLA